MAELGEDRVAPHSPANPRVTGQNRQWNRDNVRDLKDNLKKAHDAIKKNLNTKSRWNGNIRVGKASGQSVQKGRAAATKEYSCSISVADEYLKYSAKDQANLVYHEMAHSFSRGLNPASMRAYGPIEEAAIEGYTRALLAQPNSWAYSKWVRSMETLRKEAGVVNKVGWYSDLIKTPLPKRIAWLSNASGRPEWTSGGVRGIRTMFGM